MKIKGTDHAIAYEPNTGTVTFQGTLRLFQGSIQKRDTREYSQIGKLIDKVLADAPPVVTLDLCQLQHLNSVGIARLMRLAIRLHEQKKSKIVINGNSQILWQAKLMRNLKKMIPPMEINWD